MAVVAGSGTDPAPFFRVFNPTLQGERFDPDGDYVRRFVPELRVVPGRAVHRPGRCRAGRRTATRSPSSTTGASGPRRSSATGP